MSEYAMPDHTRVSPREARRLCDISEIAAVPPERDASGSEGENLRNALLECTASFTGLYQTRFIESLRLAVLSPSATDNVYVVGLEGTEGFDLIRTHLLSVLANTSPDQEREVNDWCYVNDFRNPRRPLILRLEKGMGPMLKKKMAKCLEELCKRMIKGFRDLNAKKILLKEQLDDWIKGKTEELFRRIKAKGYEILHVEGSFLGVDRAITRPLVPAEFRAASHKEGDELFREYYESLSEEEQQKVRDNHVAFDQWLLRKRVELFEAYNEQVRLSIQKAEEMDGALARNVIETVWEDMKFSSLTRFSPDTAPVLYFEGLKGYAIENYRIFINPSKDGSDEDDEDGEMTKHVSKLLSRRNPFLPFQVNVVVHHPREKNVAFGEGDTVSKADAKVPIVISKDPKFARLVGSIEHTWSPHIMGHMTDHTQIVAGDIGHANGGYLIVNARDLLQRGTWFLLKQVIRNQELQIESMGSFADYLGDAMRPSPMPLSIRVIIFGDRNLMSLLAHYDPEMLDLFRIRAELTPFVERTPEQVREYAQWIYDVAQLENLRRLEPEAVGALIEYAGRVESHQNRLTTDIEKLRIVLREANLIAKDTGEEHISRVHVAAALKARNRRSDLVYEYLQHNVLSQDLLISMEGKAVGCLNGLAVQGHGDFAFGFPSRMTATASLGKPGVIDIMSDVRMSGPLFQKANLIVRSLIYNKYCQTIPPAMSVSFSFEQNYGGIEGDSASLLEFFTVISAISKIPLKQSIAITGSLSQLGHIQPIGGVNEKIEGFYDVCKFTGFLGGGQGVIIPWQNKKNLMLRDDIVAAMEEGKFSVWAIKTLEEGMEILMGISAEEVNRRVLDALKAYATNARTFFNSRTPE